MSNAKDEKQFIVFFNSSGLVVMCIYMIKAYRRDNRYWCILINCKSYFHSGQNLTVDLQRHTKVHISNMWKGNFHREGFTRERIYIVRVWTLQGLYDYNIKTYYSSKFRLISSFISCNLKFRYYMISDPFKNAILETFWYLMKR